LSAKKSLTDGEFMINPVKLGLPKTVRVVSLVLKFINILRKKSDSFDVEAVDPRALLNYVDPHFIRNLGKDSLHTENWKKSLHAATHFIGIRNLGKDSLHTANWKKSLHATKVTMDNPQDKVFQLQ
jgi:hypothetical protein